MKMKKTLASLGMLVCLLLCMMPTPVQAADESSAAVKTTEERTENDVVFQVFYGGTLLDGTSMSALWFDDNAGEIMDYAGSSRSGELKIHVDEEHSGLRLMLETQLPEGYKFAGGQNYNSIGYDVEDMLTWNSAMIWNVNCSAIDGIVAANVEQLTLQKGQNFDISGAFDESGTDLQIYNEAPDGTKTRVYADTIRVLNKKVCHVSAEGKSVIADKVGYTIVEFVGAKFTVRIGVEVVDESENDGKPVEPSEPEEQEAEPSKPMEPTEPTEPTKKPSEPEEPTEPSKPTEISKPVDNREETVSTTANGATVSQKDVIQSDLNDTQKKILGVYFTEMQNIDNDTTISVEQKQEKKATSVQTMINGVLGLNYSYKKGVYGTYELTASDLSQPLPITVEGMKAGDKAVVAHLKADGTWENVTVTEVRDGVVYAKFESLSPVFVAAVNDSASEKSPKTSDMGMNMVLLFVVAATAGSAVVYTKRRRNTAK